MGNIFFKLFNILKLSNYFEVFRFIIILINDIFILNICLLFSYYLRLDYYVSILNVGSVYIFATLLYFILFIIFKLEKNYFRFFDINTYKTYFKFILIYFLLFLLFVSYFYKSIFIPRSIALIFPILLSLAIIINRVLVAKSLTYLDKTYINTFVVIGFSSDLGRALTNLKIKYFVDSNSSTIHRKFNDINIIDTHKFYKLINKKKFDNILIYDLNLFNKIKYNIREIIFKNKIPVQVVKLKKNIYFDSYFDFNYFFNRKEFISNDLSIFFNKVILITGAAGSIGKGIVTQIKKSSYKKLILIDNSEYNLYELKKSFNNSAPDILFLLISFQEKLSISKIFDQYKVDMVIHAAAYKHVPLTELNPFSAIKNNFLDTHNFIKLVVDYKIPYFCLISSDKAVRPTNIMGSSKRLAELSAMYFSNQKQCQTIINCVRFGNVINSSGSVLPLFKSQLSDGNSVTITDKRITRYFMTIEEAASLVLSVFKISTGGEIFLLEMGEPIKIYDLVKIMIQFSGKKIKTNEIGEVKIRTIGLREGEKLYEELLVDNNSIKSSLDGIYQSVENTLTRTQYLKLLKKVILFNKNKNIKELKKLLKINVIAYNDINEK